MRIAITGSGGLIGQRLSASLIEAGHVVLGIQRQLLYQDPDMLSKALEGCKAIFHLAGAPILHRWTPAYRQTIRNSRIQPTQNLVLAVSQMQQKPELCISVSAVGIYNCTQLQTEESQTTDDGFLAEVCKEWELAADGLALHSRLVIFRMGVVLDSTGGALKRMIPAFRMGLGGPIATGKQMMSWVDIQDVCSAFQFALTHKVSGPVNLCAPHPVSNLVFSKALAKTLHRPCFFRIPEWSLRLLYGAAASVLVNGQEVIPGSLLKAGFEFSSPHLEQAFARLFPQKK